MRERKIGVMGGTFNPIHNGHLLLAERAREQFALDRVIFIPSGQPYMKSNISSPPGELRYHVVKLATQSNPYFSTSRIEIDRKGDTYTVDTLTELQRMYPGDRLYFILGADNLFQIESWYRPEEIFARATLLAAIRDDTGQEALTARIAALKEKFPGAEIEQIRFERIDISSTDIRARLSSGKSVRYMLPEDCIAYISLKNFYSGQKPATPQEAPDRIYVPKRGRRT